MPIILAISGRMNEGIPLTRQIKVFSVRVADLEKAELAMSLKGDDPATSERLTIFGRVHSWIHPDEWK